MKMNLGTGRLEADSLRNIPLTKVGRESFGPLYQILKNVHHSDFNHTMGTSNFLKETKKIRIKTSKQRKAVGLNL